MEFPDSFKLTKLKIEAFDKAERILPAKKTFYALFNPESLSHEFSRSFAVAQDVNGSTQSPKAGQVQPSTLKLKLILDGSGVSEMGVFNTFEPAKPSVDEQIEEFLVLAYDINGAIHQQNFLILSYGNINVNCRLSRVTVNQQSFNRQGRTTRAELDIELVHDLSASDEAKRIHFTSPDVSHTLTVRAGDTLPLLTEQVYESDRHHLAVARFNGLDHLRSVDPGVILRFPPLAR
ncbi:MAG: hypothetical protein INF81_06715 [Roseomonas sp.]|nr:hypothetical protein [Roseomonas sp.]MCA3429140.1 hypothetical protein [Roseomonas sp.]MCA3434741.1 hypothetical protein [Roseomonas sp.]